MRTGWKMRSFPEYDQKKETPCRDETDIPAAIALIVPAFFICFPFIRKMISVILPELETVFRSISDALKEFFRAAPTEAAVLIGICIGLRLYCRFRGSKSRTDPSKKEQPSAGLSAEEEPVPQAYSAFDA